MGLEGIRLPVGSPIWVVLTLKQFRGSNPVWGREDAVRSEETQIPVVQEQMEHERPELAIL